MVNQARWKVLYDWSWLAHHFCQNRCRLMLVKLIIGLVLAVILFVSGDWFGVFGAKVHQVPDFIHVIFETRDAASSKPVSEVHVVCSRPNARSVCSERLTGIPGQTEITFGVFRNDLKSFLFTKEQGFSLGQTGEMSMNFIHPNYERKIMFINDEVIGATRNQKITVLLDKAAE